MRPTFARNNSVRSGFFFCGIALDPVENASGSTTNPNSAVANSVISSANRLRCRPTNVSACRYSRMKSRSLVASMELAVGAVNPKLLRGDRPIQLERCPGHRPRTQRAIIEPRRTIAQPGGITQNHLNIRQHPVRNQHRLGTLQMRIARHHCITALRALSRAALPTIAASPSMTDSICVAHI